ncbi:MAG: aminotransferase class I/II-fold pyridoxal phosphate-dependent enzyme, partial [Terriglobales bacterium]
DHAAVDRYIANMRAETTARLETIYNGIQAMRRDGLPVDCLRPQGAIYASVRFALHGGHAPAGETLRTDNDIRRYLLQAARLAVVPFDAFGAAEGQGWCRLSIGVTSVAELEELMPRLRTAVEAVAGVLAN